ncbi:MAG: DUF4910 domain-containing protein [Bacteriovoracaceae bacterium]
MNHSYKFNPPAVAQIQDILTELWPICRSITGQGYRQSLDILSRIMPMEQLVFKTGESVFDWKIPVEWNITEAFISDESGKIIVDFKNNNLHVVNYSEPVDKKISREELEPYLHSLPEFPTWIPYRTSYYKPTWGFCVQDTLKSKMNDKFYNVKINSSLSDGQLVVGEKILKSKNHQAQDILISTYLCHPSMGNNELSGPIVTAFLYQALCQIPDLKFNYRFIVCPETIGAIAYLSKREKELKEKVMTGFVVTCCGNPGKITVKKTKAGDHLLDRVIKNVVEHFKNGDQISFRDYFPYGSDERQYSSPGFDFNVSSICRSMYGDYPEYHTSADDLNFITTSALIESIELHVRAIFVLEKNICPIRTNPHCEPMLSKYDLVSTMGGHKTLQHDRKLISYLCAYADGKNDLLRIAEIAEESFVDIYEMYVVLKRNKIFV